VEELRAEFEALEADGGPAQPPSLASLLSGEEDNSADHDVDIND